MDVDCIILYFAAKASRILHENEYLVVLSI
jgi:hypothetical protein